MTGYIQNPLTHPQWDPSKGDYFSETVFEEDRMYEKSQIRKKFMISSLLSLHFLLLIAVVVYFS